MPTAVTITSDDFNKIMKTIQDLRNELNQTKESLGKKTRKKAQVQNLSKHKHDLNALVALADARQDEIKNHEKNMIKISNDFRTIAGHLKKQGVSATAISKATGIKYTVFQTVMRHWK